MPISLLRDWWLAVQFYEAIIGDRRKLKEFSTYCAQGTGETPRVTGAILARALGERSPKPAAILVVVGSIFHHAFGKIGDMPPTAQYRRATLEEIVDLRHAVLRQGLPRSAAIFEGDSAATSRHYAAVIAGEVIGCATLHLNQWENSPAWQLRGMATDPPFQGTGAGSALLANVEAELLAEPAAPRQLWCNARVPAARFYEKLGWRIVSEAFEIPTAGPHYRMSKLLNDRNG